MCPSVDVHHVFYQDVHTMAVHQSFQVHAHPLENVPVPSLRSHKYPFHAYNPQST